MAVDCWRITQAFVVVECGWRAEALTGQLQSLGAEFEQGLTSFPRKPAIILLHASTMADSWISESFEYPPFRFILIVAIPETAKFLSMYRNFPNKPPQVHRRGMSLTTSNTAAFLTNGHDSQ